MNPLPLPQPGDVVTAYGQAWAVVARSDSGGIEHADTADVTLRLRRLGPVGAKPVADRNSAVMPRALKLEAIPC